MNATHALGWALVHFLWQGTALAVILAIALALTRPAAARTRYALSILTLAAMLVLPVATALRMYQPSLATGDLAAPSQPQVASASLEPQTVDVAKATGEMTRRPVAAASVARFAEVKSLLDPALPWLVVLWVGGVLMLSVRLAHGWIAARRLRTHGTRATSASLHRMVERLATRLRVTRPVQLLESLIVEVPAVIGALRPVILVPASAITGLTPQQIEVLLAHELAHVRRYDYLVNVVQCVIETLLFYHPAVWWVSRRVRDEREHCCDDLVVQVCGDAHLYASALVSMERIRSATPRLALAATGGSLLHRVRRLLLPAAARPEYFPRWAAGVAGVLAVTVALLATGSDRVAGQPADVAMTADTSRTAPDTVLRHPDPSQPLAQRWEWAKTQARQLGRRAYWIGYQVSRPSWLEHSVYIDRGSEVTGEGITISGRMFGDFQGFMFRGVRLAPLTGTADSDDIVILFGFSADAGGKVTLTHVHVASVYLPVDFRGRTLVWLGNAPDAQSLPIVEALFTATPQAELREDIVAAVGIHGSSDAVVPILLRWLTSREPTDVRSQAAEWLGFHPSAAAVVALSRAARNDAAGDVRREAAEALGDNTLEAATDSSTAIAKTATDPDARREAVESLGEKTSDRARAALVTIAQNDRDEDVQREAVETLGEMHDDRALALVARIARTHANLDVRREAIETYTESASSDSALALLKSILASDAPEDVYSAVLESLEEMDGGAGIPALIDAARSHPNREVRADALRRLAESDDPRAQQIFEQTLRRP